MSIKNLVVLTNVEFCQRIFLAICRFMRYTLFKGGDFMKNIVKKWWFWLIFVLALAIIIICARLNRKFFMHSRLLAFMGSISYFFYLSHVKIGYTLLTYMNIYSVILWISITILISYLLEKINSVITCKIK